MEHHVRERVEQDDVLQRDVPVLEADESAVCDRVARRLDCRTADLRRFGQKRSRSKEHEKRPREKQALQVLHRRFESGTMLTGGRNEAVLDGVQGFHKKDWWTAKHC